MKSNPAATALITALVATGTLAGCATTTCVGPVGNPKLTPTQVSADRKHTGERVRWGGTVLAVRNLPDRTEVEVIGYPLDRCGVPQPDQTPIGRFIVQAPGFLEPAEYPSQRLLTATGIITGTRLGEVGAAPYPFPVLSNGALSLWPDAPPGGYGSGAVRPWVSIGIGGGSGGWYGGGIGGGIGVLF